jgi:LuxR family maltose regulon positive regulatory protein
LIERMKADPHLRLALISAPVSFAKTTLLSEWIAGCKRPVVRHSLDKSDNDPTNLWRRAIVARHSWPLGDYLTHKLARVGGTG